MTLPARLPNLPALRSFEATVRLESVSRAARELHVTDGAVSRAIRELEADLGIELFRRGHRAMSPTEAARRLADEVAGALDRIRAAVARAQASGGIRRPLVLSCEPTLLIRWLIPRLELLQAALGKEMDLRLVSAGGPVHFVRDGVDLAIRRDDFPIPQDTLAVPFLNERVGPVCRPDLADALGPGKEKWNAALLHTETRSQAWEAWAKLTQTRLHARKNIHFEHFYQSLQAAVAGAGVAIGPLALVADDIAAGALAAPRGFVADGSRYVLMASRDSDDIVAFESVLEWLKSECLGLQALPLAPVQSAWFEPHSR